MKSLENNSIPVAITDQIIDAIDDDMWRDPQKKFCYASIVDDYIIHKFFDKLDTGLKDIIKDDVERRDHIWNNMIYGIALTKGRARLVKALSIIKNIYVRNIIEENTDDMPKFDFIVQNPPYAGDTHLKFFEAGLNMLSNKGQMVIIEPATWLIQLKENGKYTKENSLTVKLKRRIEGHVSKVIIENYVNEFCINMVVPFSITYIDKNKLYNKIDFYRFGEYNKVKSIYDCNLIGNNNIIKSIFNKIKIKETVNTHIYYPNKSNKIKNNYYCKFTSIICGINGSIVNVFDTGRNPRKLTQNDFDNAINNYNSLFTLHNNGYYNNAYIVPLYARYKNKIQDTPLHKYDRGKHETDYEAECITGTKEELENWKHFVFNNLLPLFINIVMTIDQNNNSLDYVPWLVDKQYTDDEIYKLFNFTDEEIKLIETTIKKYERYSPWFKRYMCGPEAVSDEEVQNFINKLNNA